MFVSLKVIKFSIDFAFVRTDLLLGDRSYFKKDYSILDFNSRCELNYVDFVDFTNYFVSSSDFA